LNTLLHTSHSYVLSLEWVGISSTYDFWGLCIFSSVTFVREFANGCLEEMIFEITSDCEDSEVIFQL